MSLPALVAIPPADVLPDAPYIRGCWKHLANSVTHAGIELRIEPRLRLPVWSCVEIQVDGCTCLYDFSDFILPDACPGKYERRFRFHYVRALYPFSNYAAFPPCSFADWDEYERMSQLEWRPGSYILHRQEILAGYETNKPRRQMSIARRRGAVRLALLNDAEFAVQHLRYGVIAQDRFYDDAMGCLASVHIPGSWEHSLDRGQLQLFGLGVCTISPDIWTAPGEVRPEPGVHYVGLRDDLSDVLAKVRWCRDNPDEIRAIGARAKQFFQAHCTPRAIWEYVYRRINEID